MTDPLSKPIQSDLRRKLLWLDGLAGLSVGFVFLLIAGWLSKLDGLPLNLVVLMGWVNVVYGCYSTTLATRAKRPRLLVLFLVFANLSWTIVCVTLTLLHWETITRFGIVHLLGEGVFVASLAVLEWRWRDLLTTA